MIDHGNGSHSIDDTHSIEFHFETEFQQTVRSHCGSSRTRHVYRLFLADSHRTVEKSDFRVARELVSDVGCSSHNERRAFSADVILPDVSKITEPLSVVRASFVFTVPCSQISASPEAVDDTLIASTSSFNINL